MYVCVRVLYIIYTIDVDSQLARLFGRIEIWHKGDWGDATLGAVGDGVGWGVTSMGPFFSLQLKFTTYRRSVKICPRQAADADRVRERERERGRSHLVSLIAGRPIAVPVSNQRLDAKIFGDCLPGASQVRGLRVNVEQSGSGQ